MRMLLLLLAASWTAAGLVGQTTPSPDPSSSSTAASGTASSSPNQFQWRWRRPTDPALTGKQRVSLMLHNNFTSPGAWLRPLGPALGSHLSNRPAAWEKTGEGFARRVGLNFTLLTSRDLIQSGASAAMGLDPRYQRCECKGGWRRAGHALSGVFMQADASGARHFSPANLVGAYGAGYLGASLFPNDYSIRVKGLQLGHQQFGQMAVGNLALEFGPDLKRFFRTKILRRP